MCMTRGRVADGSSIVLGLEGLRLSERKSETTLDSPARQGGVL